MKSLIIFAFLLTLNSVTMAEGSNPSVQSADEKTLRAKVKSRAYPGGRDEEPLKVQSQLPNPNRKMQPAQEPMESNDHSSSDSTD